MSCKFLSENLFFSEALNTPHDPAMISAVIDLACRKSGILFVRWADPNTYKNSAQVAGSIFVKTDGKNVL